MVYIPIQPHFYEAELWELMKHRQRGESVKTQILTDHKKIKEWAKENNAQPAIIDDPTSELDEMGIRFDFPGKMDEVDLPDGVVWETTWELFFEIFDEKGLALEILRDPSLGHPEDSYRFEYRSNLEEE